MVTYRYVKLAPAFPQNQARSRKAPIAMKGEGTMGLPPENIIDIAAALRQAGTDGPIWSVNSEQLNVNLLRLPTGDGIAAHINGEVDVVLVIYEGGGELTVDGVAYALRPGRTLVVPRGA